MPKKVAKIDQVFSIQGMGTVIALPKEDQWALAPSDVMHSKERIQIRTPDGRSIATFIKNIEFINRGRDRGTLCFCLPHPIKVEDIPEGSELWLERDGSDPLLVTS